MSKMIGLRLPDAIWERLQEEATANFELPSEYARTIIRNYFLSKPGSCNLNQSKTAQLAQTRFAIQPLKVEVEPESQVPKYPAIMRGGREVMVSKTQYLDGIHEGKLKCPKCNLWHLPGERGCGVK